MKKPKYLYHGSSKKIPVLEPRAPPFKDLPINSVKAVYATHSKDLALAMGAMRTAKVSAFGNRKTFQQNVVAGWPDEKAFVYLHYLDSKHFKHNYGGEWISTKKAKPVKIKKFKVADLKHLWRKSNKKELKEYLKDRNAWRAPKENVTVETKKNKNLTRGEKNLINREAGCAIIWAVDTGG